MMCKVSSTWYVLNKIVVTIFIVIFFFSLSYPLESLRPNDNRVEANGGWEGRRGLLKGTEQVRVGLPDSSAQMASYLSPYLSPFPPLGPSGEMGPVGPPKAGWVRLLSCGCSSG